MKCYLVRLKDVCWITGYAWAQNRSHAITIALPYEREFSDEVRHSNMRAYRCKTLDGKMEEFGGSDFIESGSYHEELVKYGLVCEADPSNPQYHAQPVSEIKDYER